MHVHQEELISAYFDGAVTDQQRREVEALCAESEDARRLLDDLRALQTDLKSLPQHQLGNDFADEVLARAERAKAGDSEETREQPALAVAPQSGAGRTSPDDLNSSRSRALLWSALAVAAAVLIMIVFKPQDQAIVARKETPPPADAPTDAAAAKQNRAGEMNDRASGKPDELAKKSDHDTLKIERMDDANEGAEASSDALGEQEKQTSDLAAGDRAAAPPSEVKSGVRALRRENAEHDKSPLPGPAAPPKNKSDQAYANRNQQLDQIASLHLAADDDLKANDGIAVFYCASNATLVALNSVVAAKPAQDATSALSDAIEASPFSNAADAHDEEFADSKAQKDGVHAVPTNEFVYAIEGTSDQVAATLQQLETGWNGVHLVSVESRLATALVADARRAQPADKLRARKLEGQQGASQFRQRQKSLDWLDRVPRTEAPGKGLPQRKFAAGPDGDAATPLKPTGAPQAVVGQAGGAGGAANGLGNGASKRASRGGQRADGRSPTARDENHGDDEAGSAPAAEPADQPDAAKRAGLKDLEENDVRELPKPATSIQKTRQESKKTAEMLRDTQPLQPEESQGQGAPGSLSEKEESAASGEKIYRVLLVFRVGSVTSDATPAAAREVPADPQPATSEGQSPASN